MDIFKHTAKKNKKIKRADQILPEVYGTILGHVIINKPNVLSPQVILADFDYPVYVPLLHCSQKSIGFSILPLSIPDEGYSRNTSCELNLISIIFPFQNKKMIK